MSLRFLPGVITCVNRIEYQQQSDRHLKPGGWIEFQDPYGMPCCDDGTMSENDVLKQFYELCVQAMAKFGMNLDLGIKVGEYLERAGFTNITCITKKVPIGMWPRDKTMRLIGLYATEGIYQSLPSLGKAFANLGISETEMQVFAAKVRESVQDTRLHRYYNYYFWYAQKPKG